MNNPHDNIIDQCSYWIGFDDAKDKYFWKGIWIGVAMTIVVVFSIQMFAKMTL